MTESEFVQITTSFGLYPEMRGWSIVLAAYTSKDYNGTGLRCIIIILLE